jgi:hypothetical protein
MDMLTTPVFLRCMVTNSWKASVSIVAGVLKKGRQYTVLVYTSWASELVFGIRVSQSVAEVSLHQ